MDVANRMNVVTFASLTVQVVSTPNYKRDSYDQNLSSSIGISPLPSRDHKAVGRRPFDKMATLLAYLGPPEHKPVADTHWSSLNLTSSKFEEFMTRYNIFQTVT